MKYVAIMSLFVLGLIFCLSYRSSDFVENFSNKDDCPNLLVQKGAEIHLVNTNKQNVPGVNPVIFKNLEEYTEYVQWLKANNIDCPVLYLQETYNTQGEKGYRMLPDPLDPQPGLPSNIDQSLQIEKVSAVLDADRDESPFNDNNYPGFDQDNQNIGLFADIDKLQCTEEDGVDNAMCPNWNAKITKENIAKGKYLERTRPDANNPFSSQLQTQELYSKSNSILGDRYKLYNPDTKPLKHVNPQR